jgi:transposase InsO family protein
MGRCNVTDACDGPLRGARYLLHDRDGKYTAAFDGIIALAGVQVRRLPPRSPDLNAFAERWALSAQSEALDHFILLQERQVRRVLTE